MQKRGRTLALAALLVAVTGGAVLIVRLEHGGGTTTTTDGRALAVASSAAAAREQRERALAAMPPGRKLGAPASTAPEAIVRRALPAKETAPELPGASDGVVTTVTITTPVFDITRRYRSMEGPYAEYTVRIDSGSPGTPAPAAPLDAGSARELWWWKGAKIEVLDADGKPLGQEFMCHLNLNVDPTFRRSALGAAATTERLLTLTQGELAFALPKGLGLPAASDEAWSMMFQVLNHNRDGEFHVKQRLTMYFVRDVDLFAPIDPVTWHAASIWVPVDKSSPDALAFDKATCHCCAPLARGLEATNNVSGGRSVDGAGRVIVGHWTVPPGKSTWSSPLKLPTGFPAKGQKLHATWTHLHPFATEVRLAAHKPGCAPEVVARSSIDSLRDGRVGLVSVKSLQSAEGVPLADDATYELTVDYDNTSGRAQDSMTSLGMFVNDDAWKRPEWATRAQNTSGMDGSCGTGP